MTKLEQVIVDLKAEIAEREQALVGLHSALSILEHDKPVEVAPPQEPKPARRPGRPSKASSTSRTCSRCGAADGAVDFPDKGLRCLDCVRAYQREWRASRTADGSTSESDGEPEPVAETPKTETVVEKPLTQPRIVDDEARTRAKRLAEIQRRHQVGAAPVVDLECVHCDAVVKSNHAGEHVWNAHNKAITTKEVGAWFRAVKAA